jgi:S-adenosylmethionine:tRNA ribosyltransferase-isomerase
MTTAAPGDRVRHATGPGPATRTGGPGSGALGRATVPLPGAAVDDVAGPGPATRTGGRPRPGPPVGVVAEGRPAVGPAEARGLARDGVRMLVSAADRIEHRVARQLPAVLRPGDLVVLNTSDTLPAALRGVTGDGEEVALHLSTVDPDGATTPDAALRGTGSRWVVEFRDPTGPSTVDRTGAVVHVHGARIAVRGRRTARFWTADLRTPEPLGAWLARTGEPVRYSYAAAPWPLAAYRTDHADTPGSAEMPSAGRPVTARVLRGLRRRGIAVATVVLHCGLSSPDAAEPPYPEWFEVPGSTVDAVARARRVVAVGTTVVRALESAARTGRREGWTDLVIGPDDKLSTVDGLLTGWHPPEASHLRMLAAVADPAVLRRAYSAAAEHDYLWHEFGDVHLVLPD